VNDWLTNMRAYFYWSGLDNDEADAAWAAMQDAIDNLENVTGPDVDPALELLLTLLEDATTKMQTVITIDGFDTTAKAYATTAFHFQVPAQPYLFWTDTDQSSRDEWMEFDFPVLAVGDNTRTSYASLSSAGWLEVLGEIWDTIDFLDWGGRHFDDGYEMQNDAKDKMDDICAACVPYAPAWPAGDDCFTPELVEEYCTTEGWADEMCGSGYSADEANKELSTCWRDCYVPQNLQKCSDAAEDYITSSWWSNFPWL
jgi:hypothetical protein